jgi:hypothetical protein
MVDLNAPEFGLGGLSNRMKSTAVRVLIQPSDPMASVLEFDAEFWEWLNTRSRSRNWSNVFGGEIVATAHAACVASGTRERGWRSCLAIGRNGGVESLMAEDCVVSRAGENRKLFRLTAIVQHILATLQLHSEILERLAPKTGPWEVILAVVGTADSWLGGFAGGWPTFDSFDAPRCADPNLLFRREADAWNDIVVAGLATSLGAQLENAWGLRQFRFLNPTTGDFDW